jgi:phage terminase large subunit
MSHPEPCKPGCLCALCHAKRESFDKPDIFQEKWLKRTIWAKQKDILRSVYANKLTAVKGCHASGKSFCSAGLPLSWICRYQKSKSMITAPTERQVKSFWKDIHVAYEQGLVHNFLPKPLTMSLTVGPERYSYGATSSAGVNVQGLHSENVLIICDEAPGIESDIWDAIEGIRAGGNVHVLELGNPVIPSGHFYDSFTRNRSIYNCISISAFDTPNLQHSSGRPLTEEELLTMSADELAYQPFPSLISRQWVRERLKIWGNRHPKYLARVLGEFPSDDPYSVFPLNWIERAKREPTDAEKKTWADWPIQVGIDVAGAGADETVITARAGGQILQQTAYPEADPRAAVLRELSGLSARYRRRLDLVVVDIDGIGYNFALHLEDHGFRCYGFHAGARAIDATQYQNAKAEAYWTLRTYMSQDCVTGLGAPHADTGVSDEECAAQLSTLRYTENSRSLTEIESKQQRNARGIPGSPDRAESLIMSFMRVVQQRVDRAYHDPVLISEY